MDRCFPDVTLLIRVRAEFEESLLQLQALGYRIAATPGTADYYLQRGIKEVLVLSKPRDEDRSPTPVPVGQPAPPARTALPVLHDATLTLTPVGLDGTTAGQDGTTAPVRGGALTPTQTQVQGAVLDWIRSKRIDLVINIPEGSTRGEEVTAGYLMRRTAVDFGCSLLTNIK